MSPEEHREVFREGWNAAVAEATRAIPDTWLDPLLTGPNAVVRSKGDFTCPDIEALLRGVTTRIKALAEPQKTALYSTVSDPTNFNPDGGSDVSTEDTST